MLRTCKIYSLVQYSIINYCHYAVHYIPMTDFFHTWNFLPFDPLNLPLWQLPVSTVLYICELGFCLLVRVHIQVKPHSISLSLNPCLLHWQVDSLSLSHQGSPVLASLS